MVEDLKRRWLFTCREFFFAKHLANLTASPSITISMSRSLRSILPAPPLVSSSIRRISLTKPPTAYASKPRESAVSPISLSRLSVQDGSFSFIKDAIFFLRLLCLVISEVVSFSLSPSRRSFKRSVLVMMPARSPLLSSITDNMRWPCVITISRTSSVEVDLFTISLPGFISSETSSPLRPWWRALSTT